MKDTTIVLPGQIEPFTDTFMLALAIYREARGEDLTGKIAAGCVIRNRVQHPGWYGRNWFDVITKPYQFSSFNPGDRNSAVFGSAADRAWQDSIAAALRVMGGEPDPTGGAAFYFDQTLANNPPKWASIYVHTTDIGAFHFFKPKG
jgi:spore germination cell wall hydrolase CwlJ-like protein